MPACKLRADLYAAEASALLGRYAEAAEHLRMAAVAPTEAQAAAANSASLPTREVQEAASTASKDPGENRKGQGQSPWAAPSDCQRAAVLAGSAWVQAAQGHEAEAQRLTEAALIMDPSCRDAALAGVYAALQRGDANAAIARMRLQRPVAL